MARMIGFGMLALCCLAKGESMGVQWTIERGWPMASSGQQTVLDVGEGWAVEITVDDAPTVAQSGAEPRLESLPGGGFQATYALSRGTLRDRIEPFPALGANAFLRELLYTNTGEATQDLTGARMRLHPIPKPDGYQWNPAPFWMADLNDAQALCVAYRAEADFVTLVAESDGTVCHRVNAQWRLAPGQSARIRAQAFWIGAPGPEGVRSEAQRWYRAIGIAAPIAYPGWASEAVLYEVCAGGHIDSRFSDVGGFLNLAHQIDAWADLGITALWLNSVFSHKTPPNPVEGGWNHYDPRDFTQVDAILGGREALETFMAACRNRRLHVLCELVPHGGRSRQAEALEPWWTCGRDGEPLGNWGGRAMDYSAPEWQEVMGDAAAFLADLGFEGARIDVADGSGANWTSPRTNHASFSGLGGSLELLSRIQGEMTTAAAPRPLILPESENRSEYLALGCAGYGLQFSVFGVESLVDEHRQDPPAMAAAFTRMLEEERGSLPEGSLVLRTLNNHDTVARYGRVHERFGVGLSRALFGICLSLPGIPMLYQEEELGSAEALRNMIWARRRIPEFAHGAPDYLGARMAPGVFCCLRRGGEAHAIALVNLSGADVDGMVTVSGTPLADGAVVYDGVTGKTATIKEKSFPWRLPTYGVTLARIGMPPEGEIPPRCFTGEPASAGLESSPFCLKAEGNAIVIRSGLVRATFDPGLGPLSLSDDAGGFTGTGPAGSFTVLPEGESCRFRLKAAQGASAPTLLVSSANHWGISGQSALVEELLLRRHFPFPPGADYRWDRSHGWGGHLYAHVAPTGRLWQSIVEPLHADRPAVAFESAEGGGLLLEAIATNAQNVVLTDRTDESFPEPYALALRFHGMDEALAPRVRTFGLGQAWSMDAYPEGGEEESLVEFTVRSLTCSIAEALDAPRTAPRRPRPVRKEEGPAFSHGMGAVWMQEPGTVTWSDLCGADGRFRIRLELRHSEAAPEGRDLTDAYAISFDGRLLTFEWTTFNIFSTGNAYFGHALTEPISLEGESHTLSVSSSRPWCALREPLHLVPAPE